MYVCMASLTTSLLLATARTDTPSMATAMGAYASCCQRLQALTDGVTVPHVKIPV